MDETSILLMDHLTKHKSVCDAFPTPWGTQMWVLNRKQRKSKQLGHVP